MNQNIRNETCRNIAQEAHAQLFCSITKDEYFSWGVSHRGYGFYNQMPTLMLKVSGLMHKGWVYISLNEGRDTYEIRLLNDNKNIVTRTLEDVYFDQLGTLVDSMVERPAGMSNEEYYQKAMEDSKAKMDAEPSSRSPQA